MATPQQLLEQFQNLNPRDVGTWPILPKIAAMLGIFILVLVGGWFAYCDSLTDELKAAEDSEQKLREEWKGKLQLAVNLEPLKKQKEQVAQYVTSLEKQLPSKAEMDALLQDINQAGVGRGLQFELFRPGGVSVKDYYAETPISIRVTGNYNDIGSFASDIAALPRIVTLNNISIIPIGTPVGGQQTSGTLSMDAIAKTFRYLDPDEVAQQKREKSKGGK